MTPKEARLIVEAISIPRMYVEVNDAMWLRVCGGAEGNQWRGRKWIFTQHSVKSEIVQTVLLAALIAMEHELRERFTYNGQPIFSPHYNVDALSAFSQLIENHQARQQDQR